MIASRIVLTQHTLRYVAPDRSAAFFRHHGRNEYRNLMTG
jgi:hypothetical protein